MRRGMSAVAQVAVVAIACATSAGGGATPSAMSVRMFRSAAIASPISISSGPDRALWFTNERARSLGRITLKGSVTARTLSAGAAPGAITAGRDGALWFVDGSARIARMSSAGRLTVFRAPNAVGIASGNDGALWFTTGGESVGRMTRSGKVELFTDSLKLRGTYGLARGPDGAMWVTNYLGGSVARIDERGAVSSFTAPCVRYPAGITAGPDGALWVADDSGSFARVTTSGRVTCFGDTTVAGHPDAIVAGRDGALWAADRGGSIVRVTTQGVVTRTGAGGMCFPDGIAAGPDGTLWFTDYSADAVGRVAGSGRPTKPPSGRANPRVTFISDSVGAAIAFDTGAKSILADGVDLFLEPAAARTLGPGPLDDVGPPTVLELAGRLGRGLGHTVVVQIGDNDYPSTYAANIEAALTAFRASGVEHVLWLTLHVAPDHTSYMTMNDEIRDAAVRHPELTVLDWNRYASRDPEWFQPDGIHLTGNGPRALARFIHAGLVRLGIPAKSPVGCRQP